MAQCYAAPWQSLHLIAAQENDDYLRLLKYQSNYYG
ncbi:hypothetical protein BMETH_2253_0 [methanotrophic bacterial endosymbiont of Bathymodiolus sp.]|nr:hypothetical protein BMETH_2253_0 [methanotrophic bacterial endosymbiont of Bathymodiolus sp.]